MLGIKMKIHWTVLFEIEGNQQIGKLFEIKVNESSVLCKWNVNRYWILAVIFFSCEIKFKKLHIITIIWIFFVQIENKFKTPTVNLHHMKSARPFLINRSFHWNNKTFSHFSSPFEYTIFFSLHEKPKSWRNLCSILWSFFWSWFQRQLQVKHSTTDQSVF